MSIKNFLFVKAKEIANNYRVLYKLIILTKCIFIAAIKTKCNYEIPLWKL